MAFNRIIQADVLHDLARELSKIIEIFKILQLWEESLKE